jgi:cystathionine beta-synthase
VKKDHYEALIVARRRTVSHAIERMRKYKILIPVMDVGICRFLDETDLFQSYVHENSAERPIKEIMGSPYPIVQMGTSRSF